MPTGGINVNNLKDYLGFSKIICCGGSWMVKADLVKAGKFEEIDSITAAHKSKGIQLEMNR